MLTQRLYLDRRRLEEGFLLMACLEVIVRHDLSSVTCLPYDRTAMAEVVAKQYSDAFVKKWGSKFRQCYIC